MDFTEHDVVECRRLLVGGRDAYLEVGDLLAAPWAADEAVLVRFCERIGVSLRSAREYRQVAAATDELLRALMSAYSCRCPVKYG